MHNHGLIESRNVDLWNALSNDWEIDVVFEDRFDYLAVSFGGKTVIHVPSDNVDPASFTHELLHVYLKVKEVFIGRDLKILVKGSSLLSKILSAPLLEHLDNCLDHAKMLPLFLKLGYNANQFILDFHERKLNDLEISKLRTHLVTRRWFKKYYSSAAIDFYIGKYFAVFACPNTGIDYKRQLGELRGAEQELYQILQTFTKSWGDFDYEDKNSLGYHHFLLTFVNDLEKWTSARAII